MKSTDQLANKSADFLRYPISKSQRGKLNFMNQKYVVSTIMFFSGKKLLQTNKIVMSSCCLTGIVMGSFIQQVLLLITRTYYCNSAIKKDKVCLTLHISNAVTVCPHI